MKITKEFIEKIGSQHGEKPCWPGLVWFEMRFPDGAEHEEAAWSVSRADPTMALDLLNEGFRIWQEEK